MNDLRHRVSEAVRHFWMTRDGQTASTESQGGGRAAVVGGAQMDGFAGLVYDLLIEAGIPDATIHRRRRTLSVPGYFRPEKSWDLIVVIDDTLLATVEFKSQVGSFGNNYNNRTEEAIGVATDLWTAYREGAYASSARPWLGWLMLLEDAPGSTRPIKVSEPFFRVFDEFRDASYAKRYELLCQKLIRERLYDAACLILTDREHGPTGQYREPSEEIGFRNFAASLMGRAISFAKTRS